jgi:methyl-accepting chemotaxis protein
MTWNSTFGRKMAIGFAIAAAITILTGIISISTLSTVVDEKNAVINLGVASLVEALSLDGTMEEKVAASRGYLLTGDEHYLARIKENDTRFEATLNRLRERGEHMVQLDAVRVAAVANAEVTNQVVSMYQRKDLGPDVLAKFFVDEVTPRRRALTAAVDGLLQQVKAQMTAQSEASSRVAKSSINLLIGMAVLAALIATALAVALARILDRQIATAVAQVQSSSAELQAAANQQATGSREQATAMSEISTTITELLATSRQIADSSQKVLELAEATRASARGGDETVNLARETMGAIRRHVEQVVGHMLDLGKRSQRIGTVLEIVSELAEQTNILAINATIEASGAGDAGRRFAVVADEIRKLSDRVSGSTKEIRSLIDEVRGAVNTTVMATESSSKAVESGFRKFPGVTESFERISGLVETTSDSAREIHLSTKQQASAVEQVNIAIAGVAQATRENEASSGQTLQTASQLARLSDALLRVVRPPAAA